MKSLQHNSTFYYSIENIYEMHAANMYGCIYKIVQDKMEAEKILAIVFHDLYNDYSSDVQTNTAPIWFIKYAMKRTFNYLKLHELNNSVPLPILSRISSLKEDITPAFIAIA